MKSFCKILSNGVEIPVLGYGTYRLAPADTVAGVRSAIEAGYRHIDTATIYANEAEVGQAIRESAVARGDLFVTTKLQGKDRGYDSALYAFDRSLASLGMDYVDLYLIHWPASPFYHDDWKRQNADSWKALERLYREGRVRAIGLSNFMPRHIDELLKTAELMPMVNQIEFHPGWTQPDCLSYCFDKDIAVEAWAPLIKGGALELPEIRSIASARGCTPAQIILGWVLACGVIPLCKSQTPSRIAENLCPAELTEEEVEIISSLHNCGGRCYNPDCCNF